MKDINVIAITAYEKPELLYIYLEQIYKDQAIYDHCVRIHTEEGYDKDLEKVVEIYQNKFPQVDIKLIVKPKKLNCSHVGFHNILSSYIYSLHETSEYVIIGEEDMIPTDDYITFNKEVYKNFLKKHDKIFCVCHKRRPEIEQSGNPEVLMGDYQCTSPSCVSKKSIIKYMLPWLGNPLYFQNVELFNENFFPNSRIPPRQHTHHDGAIERIMEHFELFALKPDQARAMHVSLKGITTSGRPPEGTLEEKIKEWRWLLNNKEEIIKRSNNPEENKVINLKGPDWKNLKLDVNRNLCHASSWHYDQKNDFKKYIDAHED